MNSREEEGVTDVDRSNDVLTHLALDARVRVVEIAQARTEAALNALQNEVKAMHTDLVTEVRGLRADMRPQKVSWPAVVAAVVAGVALILSVAGDLYR